MKNILIVILILFVIGCKTDNPKDINLNFTYIPEGASNDLKNQPNMMLEIISPRKTSKRIQIIVDKFVTGGIPYYGKARISNDTLYLDYWTNIDEMQIPSLILASRFKYEIVGIPYKVIIFNYLGNKFNQGIE